MRLQVGISFGEWSRNKAGMEAGTPESALNSITAVWGGKGGDLQASVYL